MLRFALLVLLIANAGYFAWTHGWMASLGWTPQVQSEAFRLKQQVRPEVLSVDTAMLAQLAAEAQLPPSPPAQAPANTPAVPEPTATVPNEEEAPAAPTDTAPVEFPSSALPSSPEATTATTATMAALPAAASTPVITPPAPPAEPTTCMMAGAFDEAHTSKVRLALEKLALPADSWAFEPIAVSERWMVYLGKFPNEVALEKRRAELRARKVAFDRAGGAWEPGLSLGRFSSEDAANREVLNLLAQQVRGTKVVQERAASTIYLLRFAHITKSQRELLKPLHSMFGNKPLRACDTKPD